MVEAQLRGRGIADERVLTALSTLPRERFVRPGDERRAYDDRALGIAAGQTISQPWIVAAMASLLELEGGERVLEVGTGSGYAAAVLGLCAAEVVSVERHQELADAARRLLAELGIENVEVRHGDGAHGAPDRTPFDAISVAAAIDGEPPADLLAQLRPGGVLVAPVREHGHEHLVRIRDGRRERVAAVRFVPLVAGTAGPSR